MRRKPWKRTIIACMTAGILLSASLPARGQATAAETITAVTTRIKEVPGAGAGLGELSEHLIDIKPPAPFNAEKIKAAVHHLTSSNRFAEIHADTRQTGTGLELIFDLTPFPLISDILIKGEFPLFEKEILNVLTVYTGDAFVEEKMKEQEARIKKLYIEEGFVDPRVFVTSEAVPPFGYRELTIRIRPGIYYRLANLAVTGNRTHQKKTLERKLKTWRAAWFPGNAGRFTESDLKKDMISLARFYWGNGFPEAGIEPDIQKNSGSGDVNITLAVSQGPEYLAHFSGNRVFSSGRLNGLMAFYEDGIRRDIGLRKSIRNIKKLYAENGYNEVEIQMDSPEDASSETVKTVTFDITEGLQTNVARIRVEGNRFFPDERILREMLTAEDDAFTPKELEDDLSAIKRLYTVAGFGQVQIAQTTNIEPGGDSGQNRADVTVTVDEGPQTKVRNVAFSGDFPLSEQFLTNALLLKPGVPYREYMIKSDENTLAELISEQGYPHVAITAKKEISDDHTAAALFYHIDAGPKVRTGKVFYRGNFKTRRRNLDRAMNVRTGTPFSLQGILKAQKALRKMGLFNSVKLTTVGLAEKREFVDLLVELEENRPYFFELGGGYESDRGLFAHGRIGDNNLFGRNVSGWVGGEISQIGHRLEVSLTEPRFLGTHVRADTGAFWEREEAFNQSFGTDIVGASLGFSIEPRPRLTLGLGFRYEYRDLFPRNEAARADFENPEELDPRSVFVVSPSIRYDARDSFIRPRKGYLLSATVDTSRGIENSLDDFIKYRFDARYYITPVRKFTLAFDGRYGFITPYGDMDTVPADQLFFLGGTMDVRGFDENRLRTDAQGDSLGGLEAVSGSAEARIEVWGNVETALFYDIGRISDSSRSGQTSDFRSSVGLGLRYITPIGPIGIMYGWKLDPQPDEARGRIHFSIGYTF